MEVSVRGDLGQKDSRKRESEGLQDGSESCYDVWFSDSSADRKTGGRTGGVGVEDAKIFIGSDHNGQD